MDGSNVESTLLQEKQEKKRVPEIRSYFDRFSEQEITERLVKLIDGYPALQRSVVISNVFKAKTIVSPAELNQYVRDYVQYYKVKVKEIGEKIPDIFQKIHTWLELRQITPNQNPVEIPLNIIDPLIGEALPEIFTPRGSSYDPERREVYVEANQRKVPIIHEYVHALAHDRSSASVGFKQFQSSGKFTGNTWLDEGAVMIADFDISGAVERIDKDLNPYDDGYYWLARIFIAKIGLSSEVLMKALLQQQSQERKEIEKRVREKYNCSIDDLDDLMIGFNTQLQQRIDSILEGKSVILKVHVNNTSLIEKYKRLQKIFPNIRIEVVK